MKKVFFTLLFTLVSTLTFAQLELLKKTEKPKTVKPKAVKPKTVKTVNKEKTIEKEKTAEKEKTPDKEITVDKEKTVNTGSYIIVFRGGQFGSALSNYSIFIDGKKVCKLSNGKYFKYPVSPGKHEIEARKAGVDILKKETVTSIITEAGKNNYISCSIKRSVLRERIEMIEVVQNSGKQSTDNLKEDNCQSEIENN